MNLTEAGEIEKRSIAVVTGASSGIGEATAHALARDGWRVVCAARRMERVEALAREIGGDAFALDARDAQSIERFASDVRSLGVPVRVLVNNAGLALGSDPVERGDDDDWIRMWETNVLGLARVTRAFLPLLRASENGHIVNIGSVAGIESYKNGAGYTGTKHAVRSITQTLRLELNGEPIRVSEVAPGMTETEFSNVRFKGDDSKADAVYKGVQPLVASDVAECVAFVVSRPKHVNIDYLLVKPVAQATTWLTARKT